MNNNNNISSNPINVDDIILQLENKIQKLNTLNDIQHENQIKFLKYLKDNFIILSDYRDKIIKLIPYYQKEISTNWDAVTDGKIELERKKQEVEELKRHANLIQNDENEIQKTKKKLSNQLTQEETSLNNTQNRFNKNGKKLDKINSQIDIISQIEDDSNETFFNNLFTARNKQQLKRLGRVLSDREKENFNLSQRIQIQQTKINETAKEIESQQIKLKDLQTQNIEIRQHIQRMMELIRMNSVNIQKAEKHIDQHNQNLKKLSISLVNVANETSRQHSVYKKASHASLDNIDFENLLDESLAINFIEEDMEEIFNSVETVDKNFKLIDEID